MTANSTSRNDVLTEIQWVLEQQFNRALIVIFSIIENAYVQRLYLLPPSGISSHVNTFPEE